MQFASIKPLSADDMASIPADATMALAAKINPLSVFNDLYGNGWKRPIRKRRPVMRRDIEQMESQLGLKIRRGNFDPAGRQCHFVY